MDDHEALGIDEHMKTVDHDDDDDDEGTGTDDVDDVLYDNERVTCLSNLPYV